MENLERLQSALGGISGPIFLAREHEGRRLDLYTTDRKAARQLRAEAETRLSAAGTPLDCRVVARPMSRIGRYRSLERLVGDMGKGAIVYDPTHVVRRAEALVDLASRLRAAAGRKIDGLFFEPVHRTLYVIVDERAFPKAATDRLNERQQMLRTVGEVFAGWRGEGRSGFDLSVRIGFETPARSKLISIDSATVSNVVRRLIRGRRGGSALRLALASAFGLTAAVPAMAADVSSPAVRVVPAKRVSEPAVSDPNLTLILFGSAYDMNIDGSGQHVGIAGKAAIPLTDAFGAQVDIAFGTNEYFGAGGHLFWRDPNVGLLGAIVSYNTLNGVAMTRYGGEGQLYLGNVTLGVQAGHQSGKYVQSGFFGDFDVTFYATPNLSLRAGIGTDPAKTWGKLGLEWMPASLGIRGLSVFADGKIGSNNWQATAGLSLHFGKANTLIDRDRRDDPLNLTMVYPTRY